MNYNDQLVTPGSQAFKYVLKKPLGEYTVAAYCREYRIWNSPRKVTKQVSTNKEKRKKKTAMKPNPPTTEFPYRAYD